MLYKICPTCGANLDPGEKCDCQKENGLPDANQNSPMRGSLSLVSSIAQNSEKIKPNLLRELRISKNIPAREIVATVRNLYPKYDKMLQSKCERGEKYGIELRADAMDALFEKYAPEQSEASKRGRRDGHRLTCKISCRLEDDEYYRLIACIKDDGFEQMQAWLTFMVRGYLKAKATEGGASNERSF